MSFLNTPVSYTAPFLKLLKARRFESEEAILSFLHDGLDALRDPFEMRGVAEACDRIRLARVRGEKVLVHGDYDVDGVTGAAIAAGTLTRLEIESEVFLPNREEDGYGISLRAIEEALSRDVKLLVTVDCGISAADKIAAAKKGGLDVIVIDHHQIPPEGLPPADVVINPLQPECGYPFKELSAAGLAYKLSQALLDEGSRDFLDLAAISTICDMVPVLGENRVIVKAGLEALSKRNHAGLRALALTAKLSSPVVNVGHIGFVLGPRINAAGRMGSADLALRLLMTRHEKEARSLAAALEEENKLRQQEERQTTKDALREAERTLNFSKDFITVVAKDGWHQGVIGIVAARLVERYQRPAVVIALQNGKGKGSGRSVKGVNLYELLSGCRDLLTEFGGHSQAVGLSIEESRLGELRRRINELAASSGIASSLGRKKVEPELEISFEDITLPFLRELELLEPHGLGNPRPVFLTSGLRVKTPPVKVSAQIFQFYVTDGQFVYEARWSDRFQAGGRDGGETLLREGASLDLFYHIKLKTWQGQERILLEAKEIKPL